MEEEEDAPPTKQAFGICMANRPTKCPRRALLSQTLTFWLWACPKNARKWREGCVSCKTRTHSHCYLAVSLIDQVAQRQRVSIHCCNMSWRGDMRNFSGMLCSERPSLLFWKFLISNRNMWILRAIEQILYKQVETKTMWQCSTQSGARGVPKMCNKGQITFLCPIFLLLLFFSRKKKCIWDPQILKPNNFIK